LVVTRIEDQRADYSEPLPRSEGAAAK